MTQPAPQTRPAYLAWTDTSGIPQYLFFDLVVSEDYDLDVDVSEHPVEIGANVSDNARPKLEKVSLDIWCTNEPIDSNNWATAIPGVSSIAIPAPSFTPDPAAGIIEYDEYENMITERAVLGLGAGLLGTAIGGAAGNQAIGGAVGAIGGSLLAGALLPGIAVPRVFASDAGNKLAPAPPDPPFPAQVMALSQGDDFVSKMIDTLRNLKGRQVLNVIGPRIELYSQMIETMKVHRGVETGTGAKVTIGLKEIRIVSTVNVPAPKPIKAKPPIAKGAQNTTAAPTAYSSHLYRLRHPTP